MLAQNDSQMWAALGGLIGTAITATFGGVVLILNAWMKGKQQQRQSQFTEQGQIIDRQEKQIARLEAQTREQQEAIRVMQQSHAQCREESAQLRMWLAMLREDMIREGLKPRDLPDFQSHDSADPDFIARQTEQSTKLLTSVDERLKQEPLAGGDRANAGG